MSAVKLAYYPDNPDFIAEIVISAEMGRSPSEMHHPCYELLVRDGRVLGATFVGAGDEIGCSGSSDA